jgi:hypothetical protein
MDVDGAVCHDMGVPVAMVSAATGAPAEVVCTTCIAYVHITNCSISLPLVLLPHYRV